MRARAANSAEASNVQPALSLHLRKRAAFPIAAKIATRMRIAQPRNAHIVDKAAGLAKRFPLADPRFLLFPDQLLFCGAERFLGGRLRTFRVDGRFRADRSAIGAALAASGRRRNSGFGERT